MRLVTAETILQTLEHLSDPDIAEHSGRFFKTAKGEYGEGDQFLGIRVPVLRQQVKRFWSSSLEEIEMLLHSPWHEARLMALLLLVEKYKKGDAVEKAAIYAMYLRNTKYINNWDLVDSSAPYIVGMQLFGQEPSVLYALAGSENLWERRIAIMATFYFIRNNRFETALKISDTLLDDSHDLIHKAVGWMLREIGKRDEKRLHTFLKPRYRNMPRTMLRYAIEKFAQSDRKKYLRGTL